MVLDLKPSPGTFVSIEELPETLLSPRAAEGMCAVVTGAGERFGVGSPVSGDP